MPAKHILILETNPDDAALIRGSLKQLPFCTSFLCRSLSEARSYLARAGIYKDAENYPPPDAIITEMNLGADSAYELVVFVRGTTDLLNTPIYVLARDLSTEDEKTLRQVKAVQVIRKSPDPKERSDQLAKIAREVCGS